MNASARATINGLRTAGADRTSEPFAPLPTWRLNLMRVGYAVMGVGLVVKKWPLVFSDEQRGLHEGTVLTMLVAMSVLALVGLRYPARMLPVLLFEVVWKLLWLGTVALPLWLDADLAGATLEQTGRVLWVVIIIAIVPWRHVVSQFVTSRGDRWR